MNPQKISVHNLFEAKALLKEYDERGEFYQIDIYFFSHQGDHLGTAAWLESKQSHQVLT